MLIKKRKKSSIKRGNFSKKIKKDYQSKPLNNPFFRSKKTKKNQAQNNKKIIWVVALIFILISAIYLLFFSNVFKTTTIKLVGLDRIDAEKVQQFIEIEQEKKSYLIFPQTNILLLNSNKLASQIKTEFKFANVVVKKKYLHDLELEILERPISFIWQDGPEKTYSDANGCLIREESVRDNDESDYLTLVSESETKYLNGNDCLDLKAEYFQALFNLNDELSKIPSLKPEKYILSSELNSLVADLENGPNIIFNTKDDLNQQVNKLLIIRQEQPEESFMSLEYIDLRYGDLIYFK